MNKLELSDRQVDILKILKRAPKTTAKVYEQLLKKNPNVSRGAVHSRMRSLENHELVRARTKYDRKLKRDILLWELTEAGRKALA